MRIPRINLTNRACNTLEQTSITFTKYGQLKKTLINHIYYNNGIACNSVLNIQTDGFTYRITF